MPLHPFNTSPHVTPSFAHDCGTHELPPVPIAPPALVVPPVPESLPSVLTVPPEPGEPPDEPGEPPDDELPDDEPSLDPDDPLLPPLPEPELSRTAPGPVASTEASTAVLPLIVQSLCSAGQPVSTKGSTSMAAASEGTRVIRNRR